MTDSTPPLKAESLDDSAEHAAAERELSPGDPHSAPSGHLGRSGGPVVRTAGSGTAPSDLAADPPPSRSPADLAPAAEVTAPADDTAGQRAEVKAGPSLSFGFNLGKIPGQGEDADPILRDGRELGLVGVFDGMGGAGGTVYETPDGSRTGAYLASRLARDVVEQRMVALLDPEWNLNGPAAAQDIHRSVRAALRVRLTELNAPASGLRSRLLRALTTTMALVALQRREPGGDRWVCHLLWAGDSRVYCFRPDAGAQQLTVDDIKDRGDAMANLWRTR